MTAVRAALEPASPPPTAALVSCPRGRYAHGGVVVEPGGRHGISARRAPDGRLYVTHRLRPSELDDEIGSLLAAELTPYTDDHETFAHAFTGIVLTTRPEAADAWQLFYRNSLARIRHSSRPGYSEIYRHALDLLPLTSVVDLGCSFGFLSLHLADRGAYVTACDVDEGTTDLVRHMARRLRRPVDVATMHGCTAPLPDASADAVALLHVLEHVHEDVGAALLAEAQRIARCRIVIAVPYEPEPTALFGHVRRFDDHALHRLGDRLSATTGWTYEVHDHHGGWLVLDRLDTSAPNSTAPNTAAPAAGGHQSG